MTKDELNNLYTITCKMQMMFRILEDEELFMYSREFLSSLLDESYKIIQDITIKNFEKESQNP